MKLVIIKSHLKDALAAVAGAIAEHAHLPILKNVFIEARSGKIILAATNLEIAVEYAVLGKVLDPGAITIPCGAFSNIINNLQSERLNLETKSNTLDIKTDNYHATLQGMPSDEFPIIPKVTKTKGTIVIKGVLLKEALAQVAPCVQLSELRPELGSVLMAYVLDSLKFVATDSFRLAEKTIQKNEFSSTHTEAFRMLIPLKTAQELMKIIGDEDEVTITHDENQIAFSGPSYAVVSRLIDGKFPDYEAIIPKKFSTEISMQKDEFAAAVKLSGSLGTRSGEVKIATHENKKSVSVYSAEQGVGENTYALPAKISGGAHEMSFSWRYLLDGVKAIRGAEVHLGLSEDNKPALLKAPHDGSYFYIVMPIMKA